MQLNPLSQDTWRHGHHGTCPTPIERNPHLTLQDPTVNRFYYILSPGNRRSYLLDNSSNSIQRESLATPMGLEDSAPGVQRHQQPGVALQSLEGEEIAPTDVKYRLQLLKEVPFQTNSSSGHSQHKPGWNPLSKSHREWFKPCKVEDVSYHRDEPFYSGMVIHTPSLAREKQEDQKFKAILSSLHNPSRSHSGQKNSTKRTSEPQEVCQPGPELHPSSNMEASLLTWSRQEQSGHCMSCLPPLKLLSRRVKSKWPPQTPGIFQGKFQAELTGKHFFQDWRAQPQGHYGSNEKPLVPFEDQVHTRLMYMPLFTGRAKLYKPKSKHKTNIFSTEQEKSNRSAPEFWPQKKNIWRKRLPE